MKQLCTALGLLFALTACGPRASVEEMHAHPSDATINYAQTRTLTRPDGSALLLGGLEAFDWSAHVENFSVKASFQLRLRDTRGEEIWRVPVMVSGLLADSPTRLVLDAPVANDVEVYAFCAEPTCGTAVFDIYASDRQVKHATQFILQTSETLVKTAEEPVADEHDTEGVDSLALPSFYVGSLYTAGVKGQSPAPVASAPGGPTRDQVIGLPNRGNMQHPSNLKELASGFLFVHPTRSRFWGSVEMMRVLNALSQKSLSLPRAGALWIGDISQKSGGHLANTGHRSHQNGLDADIAYPSPVKPARDGFINMVNGGKVSSNLLVPETWELFKAAYNAGSVDRIFVGPVVKRSLCNHARTTGEFVAYKELLRRLRPEPGHNDHFHLRIPCSPNQPRCRYQGPPPSGPGC